MDKVNICAIGDPKKTETWSSTPFNIYNELAKLNAIELAFSADNGSKVLKLLKKISSIFYQTPNKWYRYGRLVRMYNASYVSKITKSSVCNKTLHFGTHSLPFKYFPVDQSHYIYSDYTWDLWIRNCTNKNQYSRKIVKISEKLEKRSFEQAKHIFVTGNFVKCNIVDHYNISSDKITVVGTGPGIISPYFGEKNFARKEMLFVAKNRLQDKGLDKCIDLFALIHDLDNSISLTIVGICEFRGQSQIPGISFLGSVSKEKLEKLFREKTMFIMPAINEPWGLVYIEALLSKMFLIGSDRNSFPELTDQFKFGLAIDELDLNVTALKVVQLFNEPERLKNICIDGQEFALNNFNWQSTTEKILQKIIFNNM
jgi:glycosyltransferase involved in cell wall biosynthesis